MNSCRFLLKSLVAILPLVIAGGLQAAAPFDPALQPLGGIAPLRLSNTDLSGGGTAYRVWFENGAWQGDIIEYTVTASGALSTSVDLSGTSPANTGSPPANWSAHVQFAAAEAASSTYWSTGRDIITHNGSAQVAFQWASLTDTQKAALDQTAFDASATSSSILNFLRGERINETPTGALRARHSILGDIIHSTPNYVGPPRANFTENNYGSFAATHASRDVRIYTGSNDGMLHAFDGDDGNEAWAYVPSLLLGELARLAGRPYTHHYSVDGLLTSEDAYFGTPTKSWHTVLVGGLGAGGKGWYALDITNPDLDESSATGTNKKILWEINASSDDDLGYSYGQPVIAKLGDGKWYVVMGNGYNSVNGLAKLYIVDIGTGNVVKRLSTGSGSTTSPNGLSAPALVDDNGDGNFDIAYAGDIDGNLWKFDLSGDPASWGVAFSGAELYDGDPTQPITTAPDVSLHPFFGYIVLFGTGRLYTSADASDNAVQALYGIWDDRLTPPTTPSLLVQTLSGDKTFTSGSITETVQTFNPEVATIDWGTRDGWKVALPAGYRVLQPPKLRGGRLKATIHKPTGRENYIIEVNFETGGSSGKVIFDLDAGGTLTTADKVDGNSDGDEADREDFVVMWKQPAGVMSETTIGRISQGVDAQLLNFVVPPASVPCEGECSGGFQFGHVDVDTDYHDDEEDGVGGETFEHTHQYDQKSGRVFIDYQDFGPAVTDQAEIDDTSFVPSAAEWIVVVANADLSPGSTLLLDDIEYNVVDYQVLIHKLLREWRGGNRPLVDGDGNSLIFSANSLAASGGTVRHSFNDMSIVGGGVHPTNTGCVKESDSVTNGRYRNGALVTQLINLDLFPNCTSTGCSLDPLIVQNPTDMATTVQLGDGRQVTMKEDFDSSGSFDPANYEIFGGLRANISGRGDTDAWYESTVFWHYRGDSCYGETNYEADVLAIRDDMILTQDEFDAMLAALGVSNLQQALVDNEFCKDTDEGEQVEGGGGEGCANFYSALLALVELEHTIAGEDGVPLDSDILGPTGGDPYFVGGDAENTGVSLGPNYQLGRRTWTDVTDY